MVWVVVYHPEAQKERDGVGSPGTELEFAL